MNCKQCARSFEAVPRLRAAEHRLLCGDSTRAQDVERVMAGDRAAVCVTDPPYSVDYEKSHEQRGGDVGVHSHYHEADLDPTAILAFLGHVPGDLILFSYSVNRHLYVLAESLKKFKWEVRKELVWVKDSFAFWPGASYQQQHEPIWICTRNGGSFAGNVPANESTVLEYAKPRAHDMHPTAKPVELWARLISNHSNVGDVAYEPFSGSGTSLVACEQHARLCRAIEISPAYVAVTLERLANMGLEPRLANA